MAASKSESMHTPSDAPSVRSKTKVNNDVLYWPGDCDEEKVQQNKTYWHRYASVETPPSKRQRFDEDPGTRHVNVKPKPSLKVFKPKPSSRKPAYKAMPRPRPFTPIVTDNLVSVPATPQLKAKPQPKADVVEIDG